MIRTLHVNQNQTVSESEVAATEWSLSNMLRRVRLSCAEVEAQVLYLGHGSPPSPSHDGTILQNERADVEQHDAILRIALYRMDLDAQSLELALVPALFPGLFVPAVFIPLDRLMNGVFGEHRLHEYDVAQFLDAFLHAGQSIQESLATQVAEAPDTQDAVVLIHRPLKVLDLEEVLGDWVVVVLPHLS